MNPLMHPHSNPSLGLESPPFMHSLIHSFIFLIRLVDFMWNYKRDVRGFVGYLVLFSRFFPCFVCITFFLTQSEWIFHVYIFLEK